MKVLFIAPRLPLPADTGGKIRTFNLIKQIARVHELDLVCFSFKREDKAHVEEFRNLGINVQLIPLEEHGIFSKALRVLASPLPYSVVKYYTKPMEDAIALLLKARNYDLVHFDHIHMTHYRKNLNGQPCLIDDHNVEYRILERCARVERSLLMRTLYAQQARKMKRFEAKNIANFTACTAVSGDDRDTLKKLTKEKKPVHVLPNGVDTEYFKLSAISCQPSAGEEDSLVFTGSMDWLPNQDAVVFFCKEILPLIWKQRGDVKFYVVGKGPSNEIQDLAKKDERVIVTDRVDDVRPFMQRSKIFVVPLRIGGGTRLKILEAMSMQKAVVSTTIGAEGIDYSENKDIVLADKPQDFAREVISLLENGEKRELLGRDGRKLVLEKYDWNVVGNTLLEIYEKYKA